MLLKVGFVVALVTVWLLRDGDAIRETT